MESGVDILFIAVGTPTDENSNGGANLGYVYAAAEEAGAALAKAPAAPDAFTVVVTKSTVPAGTSRKVGAILRRHLQDERFAVASNPEFLREGEAIADFMEPDRIVVGSNSERARQLLEELYLPLTRKGHPLVATTATETSELIKYAANAFLATKVTFINELSRLCEAAGGDITELATGVGLDERIGPQFLTPGPGFGGSCFPKDLVALIKTANDFGSPVEIVETVIRANDRHKQMMVRKIRNELGGVAGRRIGVLGLAFKANTDDMRNAPALTIVGQLIAEGAEVQAYDPVAAEQAKELLPELTLVDTIEDAAPRRRCGGDPHRVERLPQSSLAEARADHAPAACSSTFVTSATRRTSSGRAWNMSRSAGRAASSPIAPPPNDGCRKAAHRKYHSRESTHTVRWPARAYEGDFSNRLRFGAFRIPVRAQAMKK